MLYFSLSRQKGHTISSVSQDYSLQHTEENIYPEVKQDDMSLQKRQANSKLCLVNLSFYWFKLSYLFY